jgi:hypothetical protein
MKDMSQGRRGAALSAGKSDSRKKPVPFVTVRGKAGCAASERKLELVVAANAKATQMLEETSDRVLVVYGEQAASIYYESCDVTAEPAKATPGNSRKAS